MAQIKVNFYKDEKGNEPAKEFILSIDSKMRGKIIGLFKLLAENGNELREPYSKHLDDGIFELRAKIGTDISRVLYFFYIGQRAIVTNGIIKKTNKTPSNAIDKAKAYRKDFLRRIEKGELKR